MITRRTKIQLLVFVAITLLGVSFVGARYAGLDKLVTDTSYEVTAHFGESGGIFAGAEVDYRGVRVGKVSRLELTDEGVDVVMAIDNDTKQIPRDSQAQVANRSAVGEQYVDLQPDTDSGPYLEEGSEIPREDTVTPISTTKLLTDIDTTVNSVGKRDLRTVVAELGAAFKGTGADLGRIIDTSNAFIESANANFDVTTDLIRDSNTVLGTQLRERSAIQSFAHDLARFSDTVVRSDQDLRSVIENGDATANQLRTFLENNRVDLGRLLNNLVTTGNITIKHLDGIEQVLVIYPYVMAGGYVVLGKDSETGLYDAHFGAVLTQDPPVCNQGYGSTNTRSPQNRGDLPMNTDARCTAPATKTSPRGAQHAPKRAPASYRPPVLGTYDVATGKFDYAGEGPDSHRAVSYTGGAAQAFGDDSWKWLLVQPFAGSKE